jgi:hypothetical protein
LLTITDTDHVAVIELRHFVKPEHVIRLLNAYEIERGPLINAGIGRLQFLVRPDHAKLGCNSPQPAEDATLTTLPARTLVLLPPSRLMSGHRLGWMRRLYHATHLPAATPLLAQLTDSSPPAPSMTRIRCSPRSIRRKKLGSGRPKA